MKLYFEQFAGKKAIFEDFIECFQESATQMKVDLIDLKAWIHTWLRQSGINTLTPIIKKQDTGKFKISIQQDKSKYGDVDVLRQQMVDVAVLKLSKVPGVSSDEWDSDGELELCKKFEV